MLNSIKKIEETLFEGNYTYIGCVGFEDRALSILQYAYKNNIKIENIIGIKYKPFNKKNKELEFNNIMSNLKSKNEWCIYDRYNPITFEKKIQAILNKNTISKLIVDISGMSKLCIMILLNLLKKEYRNHLIIGYSEANTYYPQKEIFEKTLLKRRDNPPIFLTENIHKIITTPKLSSTSMQGYPILMIAYPTFNYLELIALYNEINPQQMIIIEGIPLNDKDKWRLHAINEINMPFINDPNVKIDIYKQSTFDYIDNLNCLNQIYKKYNYTSKIILAPTGSKLQTISSWIFKELHPDVQIIYPVTKSFIGEYSKGCRQIWTIDFTDFIKDIKI